MLIISIIYVLSSLDLNGFRSAAQADLQVKCSESFFPTIHHIHRFFFLGTSPAGVLPKSGVVHVVRLPFPLFIGFMPNSLYFCFKQWKWGLPHVKKNIHSKLCFCGSDELLCSCVCIKKRFSTCFGA